MENLVSKDNLKPHPSITNLAWSNYSEKSKGKSKRSVVTNKPLFNQVVNECFKEIAHLWTNSTGGVHVKGLGYFTMFRPSKKFQKKDSKEYINNIFRTNGYSYLLTHITSLKPNDNIGGFKIRVTTRALKREVRKNILEGRRYTINSILIKEYLKRKTYL